MSQSESDVPVTIFFSNLKLYNHINPIATAASADTNSLRRARLSMLAGRRASASDQSGLEENAGRSAHYGSAHYGSAASILSHKKLSSPSYIEAIRNHSNLLHRRGSHVDSYHKVDLQFYSYLTFRDLHIIFSENILSTYYKL